MHPPSPPREFLDSTTTYYMLIRLSKYKSEAFYCVFAEHFRFPLPSPEPRGASVTVKLHEGANTLFLQSSP